MGQDLDPVPHQIILGLALLGHDPPPLRRQGRLHMLDTTTGQPITMLSITTTLAGGSDNTRRIFGRVPDTPDPTSHTTSPTTCP